MTYEEWKKQQEKIKAPVVQQKQTGISSFIPQKPTDLLYNPRALSAIGQTAGKIIASKPAQNFFDILSRGNYASANTVKNILEAPGMQKVTGIPNAMWRGVSGQDKTTYEDVLPEKMPAWIKKPVAFGLDWAADPTAYLSFGLTKLGKLQKTAQGLKGLETVSKLKPQEVKKILTAVKEGTYAAKDIGGAYGTTEDVVNLLAKAKKPLLVRAIGPGRKARQVLKFAKQGKITGEGLAETMTEQAARGERGLFNIAGKSLVPKPVNALAFKGIEKVGQGLKGVDAWNSLWNLFNNRPFMPNQEQQVLYDMDRLRRKGISYGQGQAVESGRDLYKTEKGMKKKYNLTDIDLTNILETKTSGERRYKISGSKKGESLFPIGGKDLSQEQLVKLSNKKIVPGLKSQPQDIMDWRRSKLQDYAVVKKSLTDAGIPIGTFWSPSMNYIPRVKTKEFAEVLRKGGNFDDPFRRMPVINTKVSSQKKRNITDLLTTQINELGKSGEIGITGKSKVPLFIENPTVAQSMRRAEASKAIVNMDYLDQIIKNPKLASNEGKKAPANFRSIKYPGFTDETGAFKVYDPFNGKLKDYKFSPDAAEQIERVFLPKQKNWIDDLNSFLGKTYDPTQNLFKARALFSPGVMTRNYVGGVANMALEGVNPLSSIMTGVERKIKGNPEFITDALGRKRSYQEIKDAYKKYVEGAGWYGADIQEGVEKGVKGPSRLQKINPFGGKNVAATSLRKANEGVENFNRFNVFLDEIKKGNSIQDAVKKVDKIMFDYNDLTQFERNVPRRAFPFWTFTRKNIPLQVANLVKNPGKFAMVPKAMRAIQQESDIPKEGYSDWMLENIPVIMGKDKEGKGKAFLTKNWLPQMDITDVIDLTGRGGQRIGEMLSPLIKLPVELAQNKSWFFDQPIERISGEKGEFLGVPLSKKLIYALKTDRPTSELDKFNWFNMFGKDRASHTDLPPLERVLSYATGGKLYAVDSPKTIEYRLSDLRRDIGNLKSQVTRYRREIARNPNRDNRVDENNIQIAVREIEKKQAEIDRIGKLYEQEASKQKER